MDRTPEELRVMSVPQILKESISISKCSPKTFLLIALTLIFPLSFAILADSLFTYPLYSQLRHPTRPVHQQTRLLLLQLCYIVFLFAFSLLSTAAVVFTVASLYAAKHVSFSSTIAAIPKVFKRLLITFLWVFLLMMTFNFALIGSFVLLAVELDNQSFYVMFISMLALFLIFFVVHVWITAWWHLASVVSVLEPVYGLAAMRKSWELLKGKTPIAFALVYGYFSICEVLGVVFELVVVHGGDIYGVLTKIVVGGILVGVLVIVNLVGLLVQSVFYYICKSFHHQEIDKRVLHDHLGGYLGEYVPLKSSIQMENLDI